MDAQATSPPPPVVDGAVVLPFERSPGPVRLYFTNASYRKWMMSRLFLCSPLLPRGFRARMQRRIEKHRGAAKMARLTVSELTEPAREIFRELRALQAAGDQSPRREG